MAEALGFVASGISIAGFAGQVAQGSAYLYNLFKDIKNAPKDMKLLAKELETLTAILTSIQNSVDSQDAGVAQALQHCEHVVGDISKILKVIEIKPGLTRWKKIQKQFDTAFKRSTRAKQLHALERAKSMLLQSRGNITREAQLVELNVAQETQRALAELATRHTTHAAVSADAQKTVNDIYKAVVNDQKPMLEVKETVLCTRRTMADAWNVLSQVVASNSDMRQDSSRIVALSSETRTTVNNLTDNILHLRQIAEGTDKAVRELLDKSENPQSELFARAISKHLSSEIATYLRQHLRGNSTPQGHGNAPLLVSNQDDCSAAKAREGSNGLKHDIRHPNLSPQRPHHAADHWVRKCLTTTKRALTCPFGTLTVRMTAISSKREGADNLTTEEREEYLTTVIFLPATWLLSRGAVFHYKSWKKQLEACVKPKAQFSLSSVNVVPGHSKIFEACRNCDLAAIRTLFDNYEASPRDVDDEGRNLLGYVAIRADQALWYSSEQSTSSQRKLAQELSQVVAYLLSLGLDAGNHELHGQTAIAIFCSCALFDLNVTEKAFIDEDRFLLDKLMASATTDPFGDEKACVTIFGTMYNVWQFPGVLRSSYYFHPAVLQYLMRQEEWPLTWDPNQLLSVCHFFMDFFDVQQYVMFWVTSTFMEVEARSRARLNLLQKTLTNGLFRPSESPWLGGKAIHEAIHHGGEIFALLTEHTYYGQGRPWLRHRHKKLVILRKFFVTVIALILEYWRPFITDQELVGITSHAQQHNLRTLRIWTDALEKASKPSREGSSDNQPSNINSGVELPASTDSAREGNAAEDGWETETEDSNGPVSGWETEEEWEEGYKLDTTFDMDRKDDHNPEKIRPHDCTCSGPARDFDWQYWSHVYHRISTSHGFHPPPEPSKGMLRRVAEASRAFVTSIFESEVVPEPSAVDRALPTTPSDLSDSVSDMSSVAIYYDARTSQKRAIANRHSRWRAGWDAPINNRTLHRLTQSRRPKGVWFQWKRAYI